MHYNSFDFLKVFNFERVGGSEKELEAANLLLEEMKRRGGEDVHLEEFEVDYPDVKEASLSTSNGNSYVVRGKGMSGSTPQEGITKKFKYIENGEDVNLVDIEDKIVLITGPIRKELYEKLATKNVAGIITFSGSLYDRDDDSDHLVVNTRSIHYDIKKIPSVTLIARDAQKLVLESPEEVTLKIIEDENHSLSHNVVATLKGDSEEIVAFTAHYDSVEFSSGSYDNGTGTITVLEMLSYFKEHEHKMTLKFILCGSEEKGLLGSKAYVEKHKDELEKYRLNINIDMTAVVLGFNIACVSANTDLVNYIDYLGKIKGYPIKVNQGVYSSDSTPFADYKVPALSFARISPRGGEEIHSRKDVIDFLDSKNYYVTCAFIEEFASSLVNATLFPVERKIPDNIVEEINKYYQRSK